MPDVHPDGTRVFGEVPEAYHRLRPRYPEVFFDRVVDLIGPGRRALELGSGTGIATRPLLERGLDVTCVEPHPDLIAVARRELVDFPDVRFVNATFETWPLPPDPFDLVFSATAFHWIDRKVRVPKAAAALRPGGVLAVMGYLHVAGGDDAFFDDIQACYGSWMPGASGDERLPNADAIRPRSDELVGAGLFRDPLVERVVIEERYDRTAYLGILETYSGHRVLEPDARAGLLGCIGERIDALPGGVVRKAYLHELITARRTSRTPDSTAYTTRD